MISINDHYKNKYLKYKNKYFNLINKKNNQKGGNTEMYVLTGISLIVGLLLASLHSNNFFKYFNQGDDLQNKEYIIINKSKNPLIDTAKQPQNLSFKNIETFLDTGHTQSLPESVPSKIAEKDTVETPVEIDSPIVDTGLDVNKDTVETPVEIDSSIVNTDLDVNKDTVETPVEIDSPIVDTGLDVNKDKVETPVEIDSSIVNTGLNVNVDEDYAEKDAETDSDVIPNVDLVKLPTKAIKAKNNGQLKFENPIDRIPYIIDISTNDTILDARKKLEEKINANTRIFYSGREVTSATDINKMLEDVNTSIMYTIETNDSQSQKGNTDEKNKVDLQAADGVSAADVTDDSDDNNDGTGVDAAPVLDVPATGVDAALVPDVPATGVEVATGDSDTGVDAASVPGDDAATGDSDTGDDAAPATDVAPVLATDAAAAESNIIVSQEVERVNKRKKFMDEVNDKLREHTNINAK